MEETRPAAPPYHGIQSVSIALNYDDVAEAEHVFERLGEDGTATMPFGETFWAKKFGMAKDRWGCHWIVNGGLVDIQLAAWAQDLNEALAIAAHIPPAKYGSIEVRPVRALDVPGFHSFSPEAGTQTTP